MPRFLIAALYKFVPLDATPALQGELKAVCEAHAVCGTLLLAPEGLNGTLAATEGLGSAGELRATLRRFYPHLRDADPVRVLHFALEARPGEDEQEAVAPT